ncbi:lytic transglycosylase domain-containing protein [Faecalispora anaeroviscerum]|uniref:lytic transglycosylase domain-containing protein n=1 Tax=Faecalispora anaeroviscerum TaxID=2991836 RepID=UPI0024BB0229|nr:lytic transglycosylase domain-containing protein [Faecalispora anaeroviscerum]
MNTLEFPSTGITGITGSNGSQSFSAKTTSGTSFSDIFSSVQKSTDLDATFEKASEAYGVPVNLLKAVAKAESDFNPNVVSSAGAQGVMQLMPSTARSLGVSDPFDAEQNIMGGANYLSQLLREFNGDTTLAVAAYNAGSGSVKKYGGVPPYAETQNYVEKVLGLSGSQLTAGTAESTGTDSSQELLSALTGSTTGSTSSSGVSTSESYLLMKLYQFQALRALFSDSEESQNPLSSLFSDSSSSLSSGNQLESLFSGSSTTEDSLTSLF